MSGPAAPEPLLDDFTEGLREAIDAVRALLTGDSEALRAVIKGTAHPRAALLMSTAAIADLISRPRLTPAQRLELLDDVHARLVEFILVRGPLGPTGDLGEAALTALLDGGGGAHG